jgi:hypothetical protein
MSAAFGLPIVHLHCLCVFGLCGLRFEGFDGAKLYIEYILLDIFIVVHIAQLLLVVVVQWPLNKCVDVGIVKDRAQRLAIEKLTGTKKKKTYFDCFLKTETRTKSSTAGFLCCLQLCHLHL